MSLKRWATLSAIRWGVWVGDQWVRVKRAISGLR